MTPEWRRQVVSNFEKARLPRRAILQIDDCPIATSTLPSEAKVSLYISAEDSGIVSIPPVTLTAIWNKASELLSTQNAIMPTSKHGWFSLVHKIWLDHHVRCHSDSICVIATALSGCRVRSLT